MLNLCRYPGMILLGASLFLLGGCEAFLAGSALSAAFPRTSQALKNAADDANAQTLGQLDHLASRQIYAARPNPYLDTPIQAPALPTYPPVDRQPDPNPRSTSPATTQPATARRESEYVERAYLLTRRGDTLHQLARWQAQRTVGYAEASASVRLEMERLWLDLLRRNNPGLPRNAYTPLPAGLRVELPDWQEEVLPELETVLAERK